jgi:NADH:ubiquinone oxidoreductase subunit 3 (subunit A)
LARTLLLYRLALLRGTTAAAAAAVITTTTATTTSATTVTAASSICPFPLRKSIHGTIFILVIVVVDLDTVLLVLFVVVVVAVVVVAARLGRALVVVGQVHCGDRRLLVVGVALSVVFGALVAVVVVAVFLRRRRRQAKQPYGQAKRPYGQAKQPYGQAKRPYGQRRHKSWRERRRRRTTHLLGLTFRGLPAVAPAVVTAPTDERLGGFEGWRRTVDTIAVATFFATVESRGRRSATVRDGTEVADVRRSE